MQMLTFLTGKGYSDWDVVIDGEEKSIPAEATYATVAGSIKNKPGQNNNLLFAAIGMVGLISLIRTRKRS